MDSVEQKKRYSYQKDELQVILESEYTQALVEKVSQDPEFEMLRNFHKNGLKTRFINKKVDDNRSGMVLCPEKRSWNTGCHVDSSNSGKSAFNRNRFGNDQKRSIVGPEFRRNGVGLNNNRTGGFVRKGFQKQHQDEEEEPEWFSDGPTSFRETIELGGMIEDESQSESKISTPVREASPTPTKEPEIKQEFKWQTTEKSDQGGSRLLQLICPKKPDPPPPPKKIEDRKRIESQLRSLLIRPEDSLKEVSVADLEADLGPNLRREEQTDESPLKSFLNSINNQKQKPQPNAGASRIFSMVTEVAQQNAKQHDARSNSLDSDSDQPQPINILENFFKQTIPVKPPPGFAVPFMMRPPSVLRAAYSAQVQGPPGLTPMRQGRPIVKQKPMPRSNGDSEHSILDCRMHLEQKKALDALMGRNFRPEKGQNHF
ncbi:hypothetical protein Ciccas_000555 [Cichlidogyrus casuarinus]|uniref:Uncharacterized protein n=1 Tax=Cichlidogyrus casuarinus TaxID=1844966 RepID=A0ABD2QMV6_9PLAT